MNSKIISNGILRALAIIIGVIGLGYFLLTIQSVLVYILIAAIIALIAKPIILFLRKKLKFPNTPRGLDKHELEVKASHFGLQGNAFDSAFLARECFP